MSSRSKELNKPHCFHFGVGFVICIGVQFSPKYGINESWNKFWAKLANRPRMRNEMLQEAIFICKLMVYMGARRLYTQLYLLCKIYVNTKSKIVMFN